MGERDSSYQVVHTSHSDTPPLVPTVTTSALPLPPPPPPAPPPAEIHGSEKSLEAISTPYTTFFSNPFQEAKKAYQMFVKERRKIGEDVDSFAFISSYLPVKPVIQNGPLCGMVALSMATDLLNDVAVSTDNILIAAKEAGFSLQGEMFSAEWMQKLSAQFVPGPVHVLNLTHGDEKEGRQGVTGTAINKSIYQITASGSDLINALVDGHLLLVPYDTDKNHGPCLKNGHKAHWALVTGFFAVVQESSLNAIQQWPLERDPEIPSLYHLTKPQIDSNAKDALKCLLKSPVELIVFGHQGKSKYCGIWKLDDLLSSNKNLFEAGPERLSEDYVIPKEGVEEELRNKSVLIQNHKS